MMAFLACKPLDGTHRADDVRGHAVRRRRQPHDHVGRRGLGRSKAATPVVVIGGGESGILAGIRLTQAGLPFMIVEKNEGPGGTWWENRYPGARVDVGSHQYCYSFEPADHWSEYYCQQPELRDYFAVWSRSTDCGRIAASARGHRRSRGTSRRAVAGSRSEIRDGTTEVLEAPFVISAVGSLNLPKLPEIPGMDDFAGPSFHSARWPDGARHHRHAVRAHRRRRERLPDRADDRGRRRAAHDLPAHGAVDAAQPGVPRHGARRGSLGVASPALLRPLVPVHHDVSRHRHRHRAVPDRPGVRRHRRGARSTRSTAAARRCWRRGSRSQLEGRPDLIEKSIPDYPASGKRILQDDGVWLRTLQQAERRARAHRHRAHRPRGVVTVDGEHRPADVICYATGFRHNDFLAPMEVIGRDGDRRCASSGATNPPRTSGSRCRTSRTCSACTGRARTSRTAASLFFHSEYQIQLRPGGHPPGARRAARRAIEVRQDVHDEYAERLAARRSASSCGRTRRSSTATTRTRRARCSRSRRGRSTTTGSGRDG